MDFEYKVLLFDEGEVAAATVDRTVLTPAGKTPGSRNGDRSTKKSSGDD